MSEITIHLYGVGLHLFMLTLGMMVGYVARMIQEVLV